MSHAVILGASRGIAYYTALRLLNNDWTCTLLRKPATVENNDKFKPYLEKGKLIIVQGNATNLSDVTKLFTKPVDLVLTTVGEFSIPHTLYHSYEFRWSAQDDLDGTSE